MLIRSLVAVVPLGLTAVFGWLSVSDHLGPDGAQTGIALILPMALWSLLFLVCMFFPQPRRAPVGKAALLSAAYATGLSVILWIALIAYVWLRFGGVE